MKAIMAAKVKEVKKDEEDNDSSEGGEEVKLVRENDVGADEKDRSGQQSGPKGTAKQQAVEQKVLEKGSENEVHPSDPKSSEHGDWTTYQALADCDEAYLSDGGRKRLSELHEKFYYAKAKSVVTWTGSSSALNGPFMSTATLVGGGRQTQDVPFMSRSTSGEGQAPFMSNMMLVGEGRGGDEGPREVPQRVSSPPLPDDFALGKPMN